MLLLVGSHTPLDTRRFAILSQRDPLGLLDKPPILSARTAKIIRQRGKIRRKFRTSTKECEDAGLWPCAKSVDWAPKLYSYGLPPPKLWEWCYPEPDSLGRQIGRNLSPLEEQDYRSVARRRLPSKGPKAGTTKPSHERTLGVLAASGSAEARARGAGFAGEEITVAHQLPCGVALSFSNVVGIQAIGRLPTPTVVSKSSLSRRTALVDFSTKPTTIHTQSLQWPPILQHPLPSSKPDDSSIVNQFPAFDI